MIPCPTFKCYAKCSETGKLRRLQPVAIIAADNLSGGDILYLDIEEGSPRVFSGKFIEDELRDEIICGDIPKTNEPNKGFFALGG